MSCITTDPTTAVCPDYNSPDYTMHREPLVNNGSTPEQAVQRLATISNSSHVIDCLNWQTQINSNKADADAWKAKKEVEKKKLEGDANKENLEKEKKERKEKEQVKIHPHSKTTNPFTATCHHQPYHAKETCKGRLCCTMVLDQARNQCCNFIVHQLQLTNLQLHQ